MNDDEKFFAWLDGELEPAEAAEMEAKVAADPKLRHLADQHRALGAQMRRAFDPIAASLPPEGLQAPLRPAAQIIDLAAARRARSMPALAQWTAIAATLVIGIFVGTRLPDNTDTPVQAQGGRLYAAAAVNHALDSQLASAPGGDVRIGLTYRDQAGEICRTFTASASTGLACRNNGRWQMKGLFPAPEGQSGSYRMAAGMDPNLASLVGSTIAGDPLNAADEKAERDKHWR